jgi:uncharacterized protein YbjT (DUF2867 family)
MRSIAVTGATGRQGGAVARLLLKDGWRVRALTRHPDSAEAHALSQLGATPIFADMDHPASLIRAFAQSHAVFAVTDYWQNGFHRERAHGRNMIDAAIAAKIDHFVFSSVGATERTRGLSIRHFESKAHIENDLMQSDLNWTILRPVTFFENFRTARYLRTIARGGALRFGFAPGKAFQMVAMKDLAQFAVLALNGDARLRGKATEIASDAFTMEAFTAELAAASGARLRYRCLSPIALHLIAFFIDATGRQARYRAGRPLIAQFAWNNADANGGWNADLAHLRTIVPNLTSMPAWVRQHDWRTIVD